MSIMSALKMFQILEHFQFQIWDVQLAPGVELVLIPAGPRKNKTQSSQKS